MSDTTDTSRIEQPNEHSESKETDEMPPAKRMKMEKDEETFNAEKSEFPQSVRTL